METDTFRRSLTVGGKLADLENTVTWYASAVRETLLDHVYDHRSNLYSIVEPLRGFQYNITRNVEVLINFE